MILKKLLKSPKPAFVGVLSQFLLMPLLTFIIAAALGDIITPTIGMGMILVASCPGGNVSNFISSLAKGNVALSVSLTTFSSLGGLILTPFNFAFWGNLYLKLGVNSGASRSIAKPASRRGRCPSNNSNDLRHPIGSWHFCEFKIPELYISNCQLDKEAFNCDLYCIDWNHFRFQFRIISQIHSVHIPNCFSA